MKIQPHHIDLTAEPSQGNVVMTTFEQRTQIQVEMIRDHAWLNHLNINEACFSWVRNGWAKRFADHYFLKRT
jgi:hypothetical protein